jgi:WhiB family redox-sensing transcriptional regulator
MNSFDVFPPAPAWMDESACGPRTAHLFIQDSAGGNGATARAAKEICARCPVIKECLKFAEETQDTWAILGGTTPQERRKTRDRKNWYHKERNPK